MNIHRRIYWGGHGAMATPKSDLGGAIVSFGHPQVAEQLKSKYCENNSVEFIFFTLSLLNFKWFA